MTSSILNKFQNSLPENFQFVFNLNVRMQFFTWKVITRKTVCDFSETWKHLKYLAAQP